MIEYKDISGRVWCNLTDEEQHKGAYHILWKNGNESWRVNDKLHKVDGPAYINTHGAHWFINGKPLNDKQIHKQKAKIAEDILLNG